MTAHTLVTTRRQMEEFIERLRADTAQAKSAEWRRASWRLIYATSTAVGLKESDPSSEPICATTYDISADGAGFITHRKLVLDQRILLTIETDGQCVEVPATVVHVTQSIGTFKVGARFDFEDV